MPKLQVNVDVLEEIANYIYMGQLNTLRIRRYKTGKNAGKLFAEYTLKEEITTFDNSTLIARATVSNVIRYAAKALDNGARIELTVTKTDDEPEKYTHSLIVEEG